MNESFQAETGLQHFRDGLNRMLDMLSETGARVVLVSPIPHENLGPPLPDPAAHNRELIAYTDVIRQTAADRSMPFINLLAGMAEQSPPPAGKSLTSDGIHLTPAGYRKAATLIEREIGDPARGWTIKLDGRVAKRVGTTGISVKDVSHHANRVAFSATADRLPVPSPAPADEVPMIQVRNLAPGQYSLRIDDRAVATATASDWSKGVAIAAGPDADQTEALRKLIVEKNFDFFNYWRPENDTYIFGYRKHEQGRNAVEIPRFEEMIPVKEAEIARLRAASHSFVLEKAQGD